MTWFLFRTRMVPRTLALWGVVGYAIHLTGAIAEIFGIHVSLLLSLPGGLFEVAFGVWLIAKGFRSSERLLPDVVAPVRAADALGALS